MADGSVLRVVEFYSGVGGMHFALKGKGGKVCRAIYLTGNPGELHVDLLHVLSSLLLLYVNIDQDY